MDLSDVLGSLDWALGSQGSQEERAASLGDLCPELSLQLFPGAACSHGAALLALLQLMVDHHASQQLMDSLLQLLHTKLLPADNCLVASMGSVHKLLRTLDPGEKVGLFRWAEQEGLGMQPG